jgi:hypothetical protein
VFSELINRWRREKVEINSGASEMDLAAFEQKVGLAMPEDFRSLYHATNGMAGSDWDNLLFHLWSLEEIIKNNGIVAREDGGIEITIGDFLIDSSRYLMDVNSLGHCVGVRVDLQQEKLANSLGVVLQYIFPNPQHF